MPYIAKEHRPELDSYSNQILSTLNGNSKHIQIVTFIYELLKNIYGSPPHTRYFLQNEMIGVLSCMNYEWQDRQEVYQSADKSIAALPMLTTELKNLVEKVSMIIPKEDHTLRPGHLNYFITVLMRDAVKGNILAKEEVPNWIEGISRYLYSTLTRPYEDLAIEKNGDVFP